MSIDEFIKYPSKKLLAAATFWPLVYIFLLLGFGILFLLNRTSPPSDLDDLWSLGFVPFVIMHLLTILGSLGLSVYYLIHAINRADMREEVKALWAILFFLFGILANPVYWFMYIRKEPAMAAAASEQLYAANTADWVRPEEPRRQGQYVPPGDMPDWKS